MLARARIDTGATGFTRLMALLSEHVDDAGPLAAVPIAIETDKNLLVVALRAAGMTVFAINPRAVARYRERHGQAGKKSDPGDAFVLADLLRTDRHQHRPLPARQRSCLRDQSPGPPAPGRDLGAHPDRQLTLSRTSNTRPRRLSWPPPRHPKRACD